MKMHVCLIYNEYPKETDNGGIATYQYNLAHALCKKKVIVTVIAGSLKKEQEYIEDGIRIIRIKNNLYGTIEEQIYYREKILNKVLELDKKEKIDIIETPDIGAEAIFCIENTNIPVVVRLHTSYKIWSDLNGQLLEKNMHKQIVKWEKEQLEKADYIISCSRLLKNITKKFIKKKIDVIYNPIDINAFFPLNTRKNSNKILYCGALEKRKGIYTLIKAIPFIVDEIDEKIEFCIIGNTMNLNGMDMGEVLFNELPLQYLNNVKIYGTLDKDRLNRLFNEAAIGIVPSLFDNLPYVAMEECLTELPVVISSNTGITKILTNGKAALSFKSEDYRDLANKVISLYNNKRKMKTLGENGRKLIVRKFSSDKITNKVINKYKKIIRR